MQHCAPVRIGIPCQLGKSPLPRRLSVALRQATRRGAQVEKDEGYIRAVAALGAVVEELVKENAALDLYEVYFADAPPDAAVGAPSIRTLTVLKDPAPLPAGARTARGAQCIAWHPDGSRRVPAHAALPCPLAALRRHTSELTKSGLLPAARC